VTPEAPYAAPTDGVIVLGVDPGLRVTGYGVVGAERGTFTLIAHGVIRPRGATPERLAAIYAGLHAVVAAYRPSEMAIEQPFVALNTRSAFAIGEARSAAILAAAHAGLVVCEYSPAAVKQAVTGYGRGSKDQVGEMVRLQFRLAAPPSPADAADAIAVALCHLAHRRTAALAMRGV
jgi:crossover junction endodeoxyribonuclease RuvC